MHDHPPADTGAPEVGQAHAEATLTGRPLTRMAVTATAHCLTGCAIGEILGLVLAAWWGWSNGPSIALSVAVAFFFGYSLTIGPVLRSGVTLRKAVGIVLAADTLSILTMEVGDSAIVLTIPGAMGAGLSDPLFWAASPSHY